MLITVTHIKTQLQPTGTVSRTAHVQTICNPFIRCRDCYSAVIHHSSVCYPAPPHPPPLQGLLLRGDPPLLCVLPRPPPHPPTLQGLLLRGDPDRRRGRGCGQQHAHPHLVQGMNCCRLKPGQALPSFSSQALPPLLTPPWPRLISSTRAWLGFLTLLVPFPVPSLSRQPSLHP